MKRKSKALPASPEPVPDEVIAPEILEAALKTLAEERVKPAVPCSVCGADAKPDPEEQLCWVCRRLKISAWRDIEQQMPAQE